MNTKAAIIAAALASLSLLVGCANQKSQKQAAAEQWGRTRATVLLSLANDQFRSGNLDKSADTVNQAMAMDPTSVELHVLKARLEIEKGHLESAIRTIATARAISPENAEADYLLGVVHQRWQKPQEALDAYSAAARKKPDDIAYLMAQAEMLVTMDRQSEALDLLLARVVYFEHSAAIRDAIGQLYGQTGDPVKAIEYFRQASVLDSDDRSIRERFAIALFRSGQYAEAQSQFMRLLRDPESKDRVDLLVAAAKCEWELNMFIESRKHFEAAANAESTNPEAWLGVARTSIKLNDVRRAEVASQRAVMLRPESSEALLTQGYVKLRQGRFGDAADSFRRAAAADVTDSLSLCMLGVAMQKQGKEDLAKQWFESALSRNPADELALQLLADANE